MTQTASTTTDHDDLLAYPMARRCPVDPPPELAELRRQAGPTRVRLWDGSTPWLVTHHADVRALLADRTLSADLTTPGFPLVSPNQVAAQQSPHTISFIRMDDPQHALLRKMVTGDFLVKRAAAMRERVQAVVDGVLDRALALPTPVDLVAEIALPVPSLVIAEMLGVPYSRHEDFQRLSQVVVARTSTAEEVTVARDELGALLEVEVTDRFAHPGQDDILGRLVDEQVRPGALTREQLVPMAILLLVAGHETTANMTSLSLLSLLTDRAQWDLLAADPSRVPAAVEELLRFHSIVANGLARVATQDAEVAGVTVRAGEGLLLSLPGANRDPERFPDPDTLDVTRDAAHHVAFGFGVHQCLGQPLARVELAVVLETVLRRVPTLRLAAPVDDLPFKHDMTIHGLHAMPVTWDAA